MSDQELTPDVPAEVDAAADAAFTAGFNATISATAPEADPLPPAEAGADVVADESVGDVDSSAAGADEPAVDEPADDVIPALGMRASEVKAALAKLEQIDAARHNLEKQNERAWGKFGELQRELMALKAKPQTQEVKQETAKQAARLEKLRGEYPELADLIEADLSALASGSAAPAINADEITRTVVERVQAEVQKKTGEISLELEHKGWKALVKSPEFGQWMTLLERAKPDVAQQFRTSYDPAFVSEGISEFKKWRDRQTADKAAKAKRLERAIPATGGTVAAQRALSEQEAFEAAFKQARRA